MVQILLSYKNIPLGERKKKELNWSFPNSKSICAFLRQKLDSIFKPRISTVVERHGPANFSFTPYVLSSSFPIHCLSYSSSFLLSIYAFKTLKIISNQYKYSYKRNILINILCFIDLHISVGIPLSTIFVLYNFIFFRFDLEWTALKYMICKFQTSLNVLNDSSREMHTICSTNCLPRQFMNLFRFNFLGSTFYLCVYHW